MTFKYDIIKDIIKDIVAVSDCNGIIPLRGSYHESDTANSAYIANIVYDRYYSPHFNKDFVNVVGIVVYYKIVNVVFDNAVGDFYCKYCY